MSRHVITGFNPTHQVIVGWDRPLQTFFGQVYDPSRDEDDQIVHWVGADHPRQLQRVEDLAREMLRYAEIHPVMRARLNSDKDEGL